MMRAIVKYSRRVLAKVIQKFFYLLPDRLYLQIVFRLEMGYKLDLDNPQTFSEKLQWLKLYNCKPEYTTMVDKAAVKEYVAKIIGEEYIIPTLGVWDRFEDIDFDSLPNQFVLKTTHGGGNTGVVICKDKSSFDMANAKAKLNKSLRSCIYRRYKEWPYKDVKHRIIAEEYINTAKSDLTDYKFFCFGGEVKYCQVIQNRSTNLTIDFYDKHWQHQPFVGLIALGQHIEQSTTAVHKPQNYGLMLDIASKLSANIPFARIDLFNTNGRIYFGEITFYPASGLGAFTPSEWNDRLGEWIKLPD